MSTMSHHHFSDHSAALRSATGAGPGGDFEHFLAHAPLRSVQAKEFLFAEGDAVSHLYRIETGAIALYKVLADGRRQVMGFAYPGDLIGLGVQGEHVMNAQAINPTRLRCLPLAALRQSAANDPVLCFKLHEAFGEGVGPRSHPDHAERPRTCD